MALTQDTNQNSKAPGTAEVSEQKSEKKQALRGIARLRLKTLDSVPERTAQVQTRLSSLLQNFAGLWLGYSALPSEIPLPKVEGVRWAYPKVVGEQLEFFEPSSESSTWAENSFGVREPTGDGSWAPVSLEAVRGVLVPGLGFDRSRHRLGRGGGYYDRFLSEKKVSESEVIKVGVGYACQLVGEVPVESHDVRLDAIVTESESILDLRRIYRAVSGESERTWINE